jgi:hypothetical protein
MSARLLWLATAVVLACSASAFAATNNSNSSKATVYRWVDEHGEVHYGDRVPPQYSQQENTVLNGQGVEVGRHEAPKTAAQLAEDARQQQLLLQQKQRDSFLLTTYTSVKDIEQLRDERLQQLQAQRVAAVQYVDSLQERLLALQTRAMLFKPYSDSSAARRMPDDLAEDIVHTMNELHGQRRALKSKDDEESSTRTQFQADIDRYRELRATGAH